MQNYTFASHPKLPVGALPTALPDDPTKRGSSGNGSWHVVKVGPPGREVHVARYKRAHSEFPHLCVVVELGYERGDDMIGILHLPIGLKPSSGVVLQIDDSSLKQKLPFAGFNPRGALVKLALKATFIESLRTGQKFNVSAQASSNRRRILFDIPLDGFAEATDELKRISNVPTA